MSELTRLSSTCCFGGVQQRFRHRSEINQCDMTFGVFVPPQAKVGPVPVVYWLSGLTCTDENFMQKAGAQRYAAELGLMLVAPDTSPRGEGVPDDPEGAWDFGHGAGFYVNATQSPWRQHYRMFDYVTRELPELVAQALPSNGKAAISGHSMGGHGALVCALREPTLYRSVSAFAPIVNPSQCPWGRKAFSHYLGNDSEQWREYDTCALLEARGLPLPAMIDQGLDDDFLEEQLLLSHLQNIVHGRGDAIDIQLHEGYDHSYYFIASFIGRHLAFHAHHLGGAS